MGYFEDALQDLARGQISAAEAQRVLRDRATFSFRTNPAYVNWTVPLPAEIEIPLRVEDVRGALSRFLAGTWTADELRDWAEFITMIGAYASPEPPAEDEDYYDDLWTVVHDLGAPEVFGPINATTVQAKLSLLDRYGSGSDVAAT
jgi:hypothetical protein